MFVFWVKGKINRIIIEATNAIAPPNLLGIDRKIAYANKKYHSGWMWTGVTKGLAGIKFSTSPNKNGLVKTSIKRAHNITMNPNKSFIEKYGWKGILFGLAPIPVGLFEPVWCKKSRCTPERPAITKGSKKWKVKNRVKVALSTANPPQIHCTSVCPKYGMADNKLVITVAAQNDICPQIKTYPIKAVAITARRIITPTDQVCK